MVVVWFFARRARCVRALARADIPDGAHLHLCDKVHECQRVRLPRTGTPTAGGLRGKLEPQCAQNSTEGWHVALKAASATMSSMMHAGAPRPLTILRGRFRMHRHALSDGDRPSCPAGADCAYKDRNGPPFFFRLTGEPARFLAQFFNLNYSDYTEIHLLKRDETLALINDASTDLSLYESRARGPNIANNAPAAEMSLYASTVPAADASNVSLMGQMAADMQAGDLQRQEEAR